MHGKVSLAFMALHLHKRLRNGSQMPSMFTPPLNLD